jgi:hypothetical protein
MIQFSNLFQDDKLENSLQRALYAKKQLFKKNPDKRFALLLLNAHFRPLACIPFNDKEDIPAIREEITDELKKGYHKEGYVILFKNSDDNEVQKGLPLTDIAVALHGCLDPISADVNDVMLIGKKLYSSAACEKTGSFTDKKE